jgi:hypothetical protein
MKLKKNIIEKKYFWIYGGIFGLIFYLLMYLLYSIPCEGECFELLLIGFIAALPCVLLGIKSICLILSLIFWFVIGSLIGLLITKLKK